MDDVLLVEVLETEQDVVEDESGFLFGNAITLHEVLVVVAFRGAVQEYVELLVLVPVVVQSGLSRGYLMMFGWSKAACTLHSASIWA